MPVEQKLNKSKIIKIMNECLFFPKLVFYLGMWVPTGFKLKWYIKMVFSFLSNVTLQIIFFSKVSLRSIDKGLSSIEKFSPFFFFFARNYNSKPEVVNNPKMKFSNHLLHFTLGLCLWMYAYIITIKNIFVWCFSFFSNVTA